MTPEERKEKIESYGKAYDNLEEALKQFPKEMWKYKPSPAEWSIHEIIIHLADSEANSYTRCRRFIAEPGSGVLGYDQDLWANSLNYHNQSTDDALALFKYLRLMSYNLIKDLPQKVWANVVEHSENGLMTMDDWLKIYENHIPVHIAQMKRTYQSRIKNSENRTQN
ncbi:MAG: DinB family protein [Ignavibacteriales bacterium]|nr:DinB family protein [Ignavibacteriales bacterium]